MATKTSTSTLKMEAGDFSETLVTTYQIARCHNTEDYNFKIHVCKIWGSYSSEAEDLSLLGCFMLWHLRCTDVANDHTAYRTSGNMYPATKRNVPDGSNLKFLFLSCLNPTTVCHWTQTPPDWCWVPSVLQCARHEPWGGWVGEK